ncbi:MAG: toll/interleukin-1 receptor domain-containing protein [Acidimicrobiales bacterium]
MGRVFISHSSHDLERVIRLVGALEREGIPCWLASRDIALGQDYTDALAEAIAAAGALLLVHSAHSLRSKPCKDEVNIAWSTDIPIVRLQIDDTRITSGWLLLLSRSQGLDGRGAQELWLPRLVGELREILRGEPSADRVVDQHPVPELAAADGPPDPATVPERASNARAAAKPEASADPLGAAPMGLTLEEGAALLITSGVALPDAAANAGGSRTAFAEGWRAAEDRIANAPDEPGWWDLGFALGARFGPRPDTDVTAVLDALGALQLAEAPQSRLVPRDRA